FDIESDLKEIEFMLYQGKYSNLKDSIVQTDLANLDDYFVDPIPEMFTDEHAPDYSSPPIFDVYDDDFLEVESDDFSRIDALPLTNNEDKVFNPGILIQEEPVKIITRIVQDKKLAISYASLVFEDFDPPFYEPLFFKDVPKSKMLLLFSSENEEKVFKPGIYTSKKMFTDEHAHEYSSPPKFDVYDDDFLEVESDANNFYDDPFDSKGEKIKESKLLIVELDLPCDFLPYSEYDSFNYQDFSRVDDLPSPNNEDKVFNPGILIHEKSVKVITRVVQ
nr:hypothetical protein [Tanacetum cinerariifolium]